MQKISMIDSNDFVLSVTLDGTAYKLHFGWNSRAAQWSVDVRDSTNVDIVRGIAVVPNFPLFKQCERDGLPMGELMAVSNEPYASDSQIIRHDDFTSGKASLVYITEAEKSAILEASI